MSTLSTTYPYPYNYPQQSWRGYEPQSTMVVEETIEYDEQGRVVKKVTKTTTTKVRYSYYPTVTCSIGATTNVLGKS